MPPRETIDRNRSGLAGAEPESPPVPPAESRRGNGAADPFWRAFSWGALLASALGLAFALGYRWGIDWASQDHPANPHSVSPNLPEPVPFDRLKVDRGEAEPRFP